MSYLVHFFLAAHDDELRLRNVLRAFVKGVVDRFARRGVTDRLRCLNFVGLLASFPHVLSVT